MGHSHKAGWRIQKEVKARHSTVIYPLFLYLQIVLYKQWVAEVQVPTSSTSTAKYLLRPEVLKPSRHLLRSKSPSPWRNHSFLPDHKHCLSACLFALSNCGVECQAWASEQVGQGALLWTDFPLVSSSQKQHRDFLWIMKAQLTAYACSLSSSYNLN